MKKMVAIVASSDLVMTPDIVSVVASLLAAFESVGVRQNTAGMIPSSVESFAVGMAQTMGMGIWYGYQPDPGKDGVFKRDYRLVESADKVIAFFAHDRLMEGGTGHVVKAALDKGVPVEAYIVDEHGKLTLFGSDDGVVSNPQALESAWSGM